MTKSSETNLLTDGYEVIPGCMSEPECDRLIGQLPQTQAGTRTLLALPEFVEVARRLRNLPSLAPYLAQLVAVQGIFFMKSKDSNWSLGPHRDEVLPIEGTGPWPDAGRKEGHPYVRAPHELLGRCIAARLSLDEVPEGDINVVPASHLSEDSFSMSSATAVRVPRGGVLLMRPTTVHGSRKLETSDHRRVLHFVFGPPDLPHGYRWARQEDPSR